MDSYCALAGNVVRTALQEDGSRWLYSEDGEWWCSLLGLDRDYVDAMSKTLWGGRPKRERVGGNRKRTHQHGMAEHGSLKETAS
jgi:hypothetical protein